LVRVDRDGAAVVWSGAAAVNGVLGGFRGARNVGWRLLASLYPLPIVRQVEDRLYRWVAKNRHRFGSGVCEVRVESSGPRLLPPR
jgi:predicted DCC family thiol-disulfide oxidoreductase YuxK